VVIVPVCRSVVKGKGQEYAVRDARHEITILVGVVGDQGRDIKVIKEDLSAVKEDLSTFKVSVNKRFDSVDKRFDGVDKHLESLDKKFDQVLLILSTLTPRPQQEA
jgi:hypothetical protein